MAQLLARRAIDWEVESSNPASDSDKCHRVAKGRGPLLANSTSSTERRHPPALSLPTLTLVGMVLSRTLSRPKLSKREQPWTPT